VLVDHSEPMLAAADRRIGRGAGSYRTVRADLREPSWILALPPGPYGAAVSGYAIHHLTAERKRELFAELFALLEPGALFLNMDVVLVGPPLHGLFDEQMADNAAAAERHRGGSPADEDAARELLDDDSEDRPDSLFDQLDWLREAGFEAPEVHFKWAEGTIFGAIKPAGGS
jgi:hypothetical protein